MRLDVNEPSFRDRLRTKLLAIGERLVGEEGLDGLQARRVAREADCSVGSIYNVFGDIDGFIAEVNTLTLQRMRVDLEAAVLDRADKSLRGSLLALANTYARFAIEHPNEWQAVFKHRRPEGSPTLPRYQQEQEQLLALIAAHLTEIEAQSEKRARLARTLFGAVHGIVTLAVDDRMEGVVRSELDAQITLLVDVLVRGLD
jgi:AcrR family transcriptional regulator